MKQFSLADVFYYLCLCCLKCGGEKMKKEINLRTFIIIMFGLVILEIILLIIFKPSYTNSMYCKEAICNEDASLCYAYDLDSNGNTIVVWRGSCQNGN